MKEEAGAALVEAAVGAAVVAAVAVALLVWCSMTG